MVKRSVKRTTKKADASPPSNICDNDPKKHEIGDKEDVFDDQEGMPVDKVRFWNWVSGVFFLHSKLVTTSVSLFGYLTW